MVAPPLHELHDVFESVQGIVDDLLGVGLPPDLPPGATNSTPVSLTSKSYTRFSTVR